MRISAYTSVPFEPFDALFRRTYGRAFPEALFEWKYRRNPHGAVTLWAVMDDDDDAWLGALALCPRRFRHDSDCVLAGQLIDGMTAPAARMRGVFRQLLTRVWEEHIELGYDFIFGLCEAQGMSVHALRKVEFLHEIGEFQSTTRFLRARAADQLASNAALRIFARAGMGMWLNWLDRGTMHTNGAITEGGFASDEPGFVVDEDWVRWRIAAPGTTQRAYGWRNGGAIVETSKGIANVFLLRASEKKELSGLLRRLRADGFSKTTVYARIPRAQAELLRSSGFINRPGDNPLVLFAGSTKWSDALMREISDTWVARADLDVP